MNLAVLKASRRRPVPGDFFVMKPRGDFYLFGRVIRSDTNAGGFPNAILIYIYAKGSRTKDLPFKLSPDGLLVPPIMTNSLPWSKGYFEFIGNQALSRSDCLSRHCFRDERGLLFDELGNSMTKAVKPIGDWGLHSYRTIDDLVSAALGLPLSP